MQVPCIVFQRTNLIRNQQLLYYVKLLPDKATH